MCDLENKVELLYSFIRSHLKSKILVFMNACKEVYDTFSIVILLGSFLLWVFPSNETGYSPSWASRTTKTDHANLYLLWFRIPLFVLFLDLLSSRRNRPACSVRMWLLVVWTFPILIGSFKYIYYYDYLLLVWCSSWCCYLHSSSGSYCSLP